MALSGKMETEFEIQAAAAKLYSFIRKQLYQLPNISTALVHGAKIHEGDWETVGSVYHWECNIDGKRIRGKEKAEAIDDEKMSITYNIFGGEVSENYKSLKCRIQVIEKENGGGLVKWSYEYEKVSDNIAGPAPQALLDAVVKMTKDIDAYLAKA